MTDQDEMQLDEQAPYRGASPWAFAVKYQFTKAERKAVAKLKLKDMSLELQQGVQSLWIVAKWSSGSGIVIRTSFSPEEGLVVDECRQEEWSAECICTSPAGKYRVMIEIIEPEKQLIHFTVWLTPEGELSIPFWPSDTYPIDKSGDPIATEGVVHAAQRGPAMGFVYASLTKPESGSFLYFQNLTSLNDLCEQTHAVPETRVGGSWPELGYTPPIAERKPLEPGKEVVLSDGYVHFSPKVPEDVEHLAQLFFDMLAEIYLQIPHPDAIYQDWLSMAEDTIRDLEHEDCVTTFGGQRYLNAYVGTGDRRPESLVQLAVALPLLEYEDWRGRKIPLIDELRETLPSFYYEDVGCIMRYPKTMKDVDGSDVDEKGTYEVDAWYLYHPLVNMARLAARGHEDVKELLLRSIEYAVKVAQHFEYKWPVLFDAKTLEVMRHAPSRELGETDVAGLYAYLMLQMRDITGDEHFLDEAKRSAETLKGLNFNVGYQFNNTAWGANALAKLWQATGNDDYLHLSSMCIASILQNAFIWDCDYGYAKHYVTFMGVTPLREGPYIAAYEEMEIFSAFHEYLKLVDAHVSPSIHMLVSEYCKYATDGKICAYPRNLPEEIIAENPRNGHINRDLAIPLEDIYQGWEKPGQVGQEVYGAGTAPGITARCFIRVADAPFILYCQYPIYDFNSDTGAKMCEFKVHGDGRLKCTMRLIPTSDERIGDVKINHVDSGEELQGARVAGEHLEYHLPGGAHIVLKWD
ncbi:MAG: hypothetical protein ABFD54_01590 [Armatimonadota bacterium]|nr:hypothetical protein [bacterium]